MKIIRTLLLLGVAYAIVRKLINTPIPAAALQWDDAQPTGDDAGERVEADKKGPANGKTGDQPFGGNGAFGSHAPYGTGPKAH